MKRQLSIQYKDLVNFINDKKKYLRLAQIITYFRFPPKQYADIFYKLYADKNDTDEMLDYAIPIITDIYNDNYELKESSCYWKFKELRVVGRCDLYFGTTFNDEPLLVDISGYDTAKKCTKSELNNYLCDTELTADNFRPVEEIKND